MKSAAEWMDHYDPARADCFGQAELTPEVIKSIQLDAVKHGMTIAAEIVERLPIVKSDQSVYCAYDIHAAILSGRDNLKSVS